MYCDLDLMTLRKKYKVHRIYFSKNYGTAAQNTRIEQYKLIERGMIFHAVVVFFLQLHQQCLALNVLWPSPNVSEKKI